jgi:hypothetical protein
LRACSIMAVNPMKLLSTSTINSNDSSTQQECKPIRVFDVMTRRILTLNPENSFYAAIALMATDDYQ